MRMWKKILTSVITVAMLFTLMTSSVCASQAVEPPTDGGIKASIYTYTVKFYVGNQGTFAAYKGLTVPETVKDNVELTGDSIVITGLLPGDAVGFNVQTEGDVTLKNAEKYYVKGVRLSGRDNNTVADSVFTVDGDADYVVAYGIKGDQVKYVVKYEDENGNKLASSDTFYGNVGDKPIIAYKYIEGYAPKYLGVTKTLSADESKNVFTFIYEEIPEGAVIEDYTYIYGSTVTAGGTGASNVTGEGTNGAENEGGEGVGEDAEAGEGNATGEGDTIVDLDDEETPLANIEVDADEETSGSSIGVYTALGLLAVIIAAVVAYIVSKKKKIQE